VRTFYIRARAKGERRTPRHPHWEYMIPEIGRLVLPVNRYFLKPPERCWATGPPRDTLYGEGYRASQATRLAGAVGRPWGRLPKRGAETGRASARTRIHTPPRLRSARPEGRFLRDDRPHHLASR